MAKRAVIIKGNPKLVEGNSRADAFYKELAAFLEELGYEVAFDQGQPFTTPEPVDLWIGHSRGSDRLRFAPKSTITIGIGVPRSTDETPFPVVNHPRDQLVQRVFNRGVTEQDDESLLDDTHHYILTGEMKKQIKEILGW